MNFLDVANAAYDMPPLLDGIVCHPFQNKGDHGVFIQTPRAAYIGIAGTDEATDWKENLKAFRKASIPNIGKVHRGFEEAEAQIFPQIYSLLKRFYTPYLPLYLIGHSKGGAMAQLTALKLKQRGILPSGVISFGAPRVFSRKAALGASISGILHRRFVNGRDAGPRTPPVWMGYRHWGAPTELEDVGFFWPWEAFTRHPLEAYAERFTDTDMRLFP